MNRKRPLLRFGDMTLDKWRAFEHGQFEKDYARWMDEQIRGDDARDAYVESLVEEDSDDAS